MSGVRRPSGLLLTAVVGGLAVCAAGCGGTSTRSAPAPGAEVTATAATSPTAPAAHPGPRWASRLPSRTTQVVRTVSDHRYCARVYCTVTQAWERRSGTWTMLREFRSTIGPRGWGKTHENDQRSPDGVFRIVVTFSTGEQNPGAMPWRRRLPTSTVSDEHGPFYNTWIEEPGRTDGDRPAMRYGFIVDYNHVRLRPGAGPAPDPTAGSGIFYHTARPGHRWEPTDGCTSLGRPADMRWVLRWLRPEAEPRVVQNL